VAVPAAIIAAPTPIVAARRTIGVARSWAVAVVFAVPPAFGVGAGRDHLSRGVAAIPVAVAVGRAAGREAVAALEAMVASTVGPRARLRRGLARLRLEIAAVAAIPAMLAAAVPTAAAGRALRGRRRLR